MLCEYRPTRTTNDKGVSQNPMIPAVSVIVPMFNRQGLVEETIGSVRSQSFGDVEIVVVDDGSDDAGPDAVERLVSRDSRVRLVRRQGTRKGACICRNIGLSQSRGRYVLFLDSDDLLAENCIKKRVAELEGNQALDFVVGQALIFRNSPGDQRTLWNFCDAGAKCALQRFLDQDMPWANGGPLWRREVLGRIGGWNESLACFQDWEFHIRACISGGTYLQLPEPDFFVRRCDKTSRISNFHADTTHIASRFESFASVVAELTKRKLLQGKNRLAARALVIRNLLDIADTGVSTQAFQRGISPNLLALTTSIDRSLINWLAKRAPDWRWNPRIRRVADYWWKGLAYNSYNLDSTHLHVQWDLTIPNMKIVN